VPRDRRRVVLEAGPKIDLKHLSLRPLRTISCRWRYELAELDVEGVIALGETTGTMTLTYDGTMQVISVTSLPRPYGGRHWYLTCPVTGRRVRTLWRPPGARTFASRHAWGRQVAYAVQFEDAAARAWSAKRRVVRRLGGHDPDDYTLPRRPPGMRRHTYDSLTARYWDAEERLDELIVGVVGRLVRRYGEGVLPWKKAG
jgi:hypothetical protein